MKKLLGALSLASGLALLGCGSSLPPPDYPSPAPGKMPGTQFQSQSGTDLDSLMQGTSGSSGDTTPMAAPATQTQK